MSKKQIVLLCLPLALVAILACNDDGVRPGGGGGDGNLNGRMVTGVWGGRYVRMAADWSGAELEYSCAVGTIDGRLIMNGLGYVEATGTYTFGSGGPFHVGERPDTHPARYRACVKGDTMTLRITITDLRLEFGPYTLTRGEYGEVLICV